ncbi:MAG: type I methionyl aminopeptidase [Candidatus Saccharimonadales bacterium]
MRPKNLAEIESMRIGGKMLATVLDILSQRVAPGVSTQELDDIATKEIKSLGGRPSFLNHEGFPKAICTSINDEIVHGLPSPKRIIKKGDVIGIDCGIIYRNLIVDAAITVYTGENPPGDVKRLLEGTKKALDAGIAALRGDGTRVGDISNAVQSVLDREKLGIIRDLVGHGVGDAVHESPNIPNYGVAGTGPVLHAGMTVAIEPMASLGDWRVTTAKDGWAVVMQDGSVGAHFEHTVLITDDSAEILTSL